MQGIIRRNILSLAPDCEVEAAGNSGIESTHSHSVESEVTVESSWAHPCELCCIADARLDNCTAWTDEKHNSYLGYLESSFLMQLYGSISLHHRKAEGKTGRPISSHDRWANSYKSTDQFTVLQNGCRQEINFEKKQAFWGTKTDYHVLGSPWIRYFTYPSRNHIFSKKLVHTKEINGGGDETFSCGSMRNPQLENYSCQGTLGGSTAEASDQNFPDEDIQEK